MSFEDTPFFPPAEKEEPQQNPIYYDKSSTPTMVRSRFTFNVYVINNTTVYQECARAMSCLRAFRCIFINGCCASQCA